LAWGASTIALFAVRLAAISRLASPWVVPRRPLSRGLTGSPARRVGIAGAVLILTGVLTESVQYWVVIFNLRVG
jgi:hypothetical protein